MGTRAAVIFAIFLWAAATASAADLLTKRGSKNPYVEFKERTEQELKWDNGTLGYVLAQFVAGAWVGNEFECATISANNIKLIRVRSSGEWPNGRWDGFHLGVYDFRASIPGARIWGPKFVKGSGSGYPWRDFGVNWTLPKGVTKFVAAMGQCYNYPNVDPYCLDTAPPQRRGWTYYLGVWQRLESESNLMFRVVMQGDIGVEPTSIGRVKALYY